MLAMACVTLGGCSRPASQAATSEVAAASQPKGAGKMEKACFAAGCFWGVEAAFRQVPGVVETAVGYSGGTTDEPTYKEVCSGRTGHAEVVQVDFDAETVSFQRLLEVFFAIHDPTTLNRQGPDVGSQYRSAVFYHSPEQKTAAEAMKQQLEASGKFSRPIVTEVTPASAFWRAEEYHQRYVEKHGGGGCHVPGL
jgi:peptide-methionine (S)-S-oxide reductase